MDKPVVNRWAGKSAEDVLTESFHELRNPIVSVAGYLDVLNSVDLSEEQAQKFIDLALQSAFVAKDIVDSVYQYLNIKRIDQ